MILLIAYIPFATNFGIRLIKEDALDFPSFYYATQLAYKENKSPYNPQEWKLVQQAYSSKDSDLFPFIYLPPSLLIFYPLSLLNYETARIVMLVLNHILTFLFLKLMLFKILAEKPSELFSAFFVVYLFAFFPLAINVYYGQINLFILILVCLAWYFTKQNRSPIEIAIPLTLAIALKLYPVLLLIPLVVCKNYKAVLWTMALLFILSIGSYLILPSEIWSDWYSFVLTSSFSSQVLGVNITNPANQSINGLLSRAFYGHNVRFGPILTPRPQVASMLPFVISGSVVFISTLISYLGKKRQSQEMIDTQFSFWLLVMFMVAPISWNHHLTLILPSIFVLIKHCLDTRANKALSLVVFGTSLFLAYNFPFNHPAFREEYKTLLISGQLYAVALLWLTTLVLLLRRGKPLT